MRKSTVYLCSAADRAAHYEKAVNIGLSVPASANGEEPVSHYYAHGWVEAGDLMPDWVEVFEDDGTPVENVQAMLGAKGLQHVDEHEPPGPPEKLPDLLAYQFQAMLDLGEIRDKVYAAIDGLSGEQATVVRARLKYTPSFSRADPLFDMLGSAVGLLPEQIDNLWRTASTL